MINHKFSLSERMEGRANNFDFIRLVCAIVVIFSHSYPLTKANNNLEPLNLLTKGQWTFGGIAVAIFFVLSGFLVSRSFERTNIKQFLTNRFLRIFPGLAVAIILSALLLGPILTAIPLEQYFKHSLTYSYLKNMFTVNIQYGLPGVFETNIYPNAVNGSIWTIPYEVLCYLLVLFLGYYGLLKKEKSLLLIFVILFVISKVLPIQYGLINLNGFVVVNLIELLLFFVMGMLYYGYRNHIKFKDSWAGISLGILVISLFIGDFKTIFLFLGTYLIFYLSYHPKIKLHNCSKFGDFSYGVYIYAFPVQQIVQLYLNQQTSAYINFIISLTVTFVLAVFSWHLVEKPALKLKEKSGFLIKEQTHNSITTRGEL
ncbi:acyltransferase [Paenibacillus chitinolyticus]|uniref:acyltransferase family protein n=1 Tax=Paenibacillus chitinolyticus TaxID=79263 RepID=UPI002DB8A109|nr:acyltransferase [Paenibacillus chitinolyticus]MEC0245089.1 acyltransferase [Paenibacillus chitinolyticus]